MKTENKILLIVLTFIFIFVMGFFGTSFAKKQNLKKVIVERSNNNSQQKILNEHDINFYDSFHIHLKVGKKISFETRAFTSEKIITITIPVGTVGKFKFESGLLPMEKNK